MEAKDYPYDIAFSFLAQDEAIAVRLSDHFDGSYNTFIYSKKQEIVAGTDGEITFGNVFGKDARLVIVLYRDGWGTTPWTRIEETAIRNRGYDEGYEFVLFVLLDKNTSIPQWLPKSQIWIGFDRWGIDCAASVIDARFQSLGGSVKGATIEQCAALLERSINLQKYRETYRNSPSGITMADASFIELTNEIERRIPSIQVTAPALALNIQKFPNMIAVLSDELSLLICWQKRFSNTLNESKLEASIWRGNPPLPSFYFYEEKRPAYTVTFLPDVLGEEQPCWTMNSSQEQKSFTSGPAAEFLLNWWLKKFQEHQKTSNRVKL